MWNLMRFSFLLIVFISFGNCANIGKYPVAFLGLDDAGKEFHVLAPGKRYNKKIGKYFESISKESMVVLDEHSSISKWQLKRIDIGLGITVKLGFAVVSMDATPSFRMTFKKQ
jgi:hypothetical protein